MPTKKELEAEIAELKLQASQETQYKEAVEEPAQSDAEMLGLRDNIDAMEEDFLERKAEMEAKLPRCGHVNTQSYDVDNKLDNITCELAERHEGNHSAPHEELDPLNPEGTTAVEREWSDAVDRPPYVPPTAKEIEEGTVVPGWVAEREPAPSQYVRK